MGEQQGEVISDAEEMDNVIQAALKFAEENPDADEKFGESEESSEEPEEEAAEEPAETEEVETEETEEETEEEPEEEPEKKETDEERETRKAKAKETNEKHDDFLKQAKKLGYKIDAESRRVAHAERTKLWKKREEFRQEKELAEKELERRFSGLSKRFEKYAQIEKAIEADDMNGVAQAMGYESWEKVNENHLKKLMSPEYKEIQALKKREQERESQFKAQREKMEQERKAQEQAAAEREYAEEVSTHLGTSDDFSDWSDDPDFVNAVITIQRQSYDGEQTISIAEAAKQTRESAYAMYQKLHNRFGQADNPEEAPGSEDIAETQSNGRTVEKRKGRKTKTISQKETADASPTAELDPDSPEWFEKHIQLMKEANAQGAGR